MKLRTFAGIVMWGFVLLFSVTVRAEYCPQSYCYEYLAKFSRQAPDSEIDAIIKKDSLSLINYFESSRIYYLVDDQKRPQEEVLQELNAETLVIYAEPNYSILATSVPNDPLYPNLWALNNEGQYQGLAGIDMGMESVWDSLLNPNPIVVAILDSGIDYNHEDLADNMWVNEDEIPGNGKDDDGNGYVDDEYGYNFYSDTSDPADDYFHGTHVAGIIGAVSNNGIGVTGIDWNVKLMSLKFMGSDGKGPLSGAIEAIDYAVKNGAKIINNSWDFTYPGLAGLPASPSLEPVQSLRDAIVAADRAGVIFVAAAGNNAQNNDALPTYPASYSVGNIISVTSVDNKNVLSPFSNYGAVSVDVGAPGVMIESTFPTWKENPPYHFLSGTSMACPEVTGAAALLWADHPEYTHRQVIDHILQGVAPVSTLSGKSVTGGRVDLAGAFALSSSKINHPPVASAGSIQSKTAGDTVLLVGTATDADGDTPLTYQWTLLSPIGEVNKFSTSQVSFKADLVGTYLATLVASDGKSFSLPASTKIFVSNPSTLNHLPVATAGPNQLRHVGDTVLLQGKGSDQDGNFLTYKWTLALPVGSKAVLLSANTATASFIPDMTGTFSATLVVNDGKSSSLPSTAKIYVTIATTTNHPPVASAGPSQLRRVGDTVLLQGKGSDSDGDTLSYQWSLSVPSGSKTILQSATSATSFFNADTTGTYLATIVVSDGKGLSASATATIYIIETSTQSANLTDPVLSETESPTINAVIEAQKEDATSNLDPSLGDLVKPGETLRLDGTGSNISVEVPMDYEWILVEKPVGSDCVIEASDQAVAYIKPDLEGRYAVELNIIAGKYSANEERAFTAQIADPALTGNTGTQAGNTDTASGTQSAGGCSLMVH